MEPRLKELLDRMTAPGPFPNMSASEGHELVEMVYELFEQPPSPQQSEDYKRQRDLLGEQLGRILVALKVINPMPDISGPGLLMAAIDYAEHLESQTQRSEGELLKVGTVGKEGWNFAAEFLNTHDGEYDLYVKINQ